MFMESKYDRHDRLTRREPGRLGPHVLALSPRGRELGRLAAAARGAPRAARPGA